MAGNRTGKSAHAAQNSGTYKECSQIQPFIKREELEEGELNRFVDHLQYCKSCIDALVDFHYEVLLSLEKASEKAADNPDWPWREGVFRPVYKPLNLAGTTQIAAFGPLSAVWKILAKNDR